MARFKVNNLPRGVRLIAWARTTRWVGWGFAESLIPLLIFSFSDTFAEAGLFQSTVEIASLLALPIIGVLADRIPSKYLIIGSLALYPLVGLSYFLVGALGLAVFIVVARAINGFTWELENIGASTYYRRATDHSNLASSFGYIETWSHVGWIAAALIGMMMIRFVPIHYLLLLIAPTSIIALFIVWRIPKDSIVSGGDGKKLSLTRSYRDIAKEWLKWDSQLWLLGAIVLFSGVVETLMWFFIPIDAYIQGVNPALVILLGIAGATPSLFGYVFGRLADHNNQYRLMAIGLVFVAAIMIMLAMFPAYIFKLLASFLLGVLLELFYIIQQSLVTVLGPSETYGRRGGAFEIIVTLGSLTAPLIIGITLDIIGFANVSLVIAATSVVLAVLYFSIKSKNKHLA